MLDLDLGVQWFSLFCDCKYGLKIQLGWEQHLFFNQNQLFRVVNKALLSTGGMPTVLSEENIYIQGRGPLSTQGWMLRATFEF